MLNAASGADMVIDARNVSLSVKFKTPVVLASQHKR